MAVASGAHPARGFAALNMSVAAGTRCAPRGSSARRGGDVRCRESNSVVGRQAPQRGADVFARHRRAHAAALVALVVDRRVRRRRNSEPAHGRRHDRRHRACLLQRRMAGRSRLDGVSGGGDPRRVASGLSTTWRLGIPSALAESIDRHWPQTRELTSAMFDPNLGIFIQRSPGCSWRWRWPSQERGDGGNVTPSTR